MASISVLGAGSWALGISLLLNDNGHDVTIWSAVPEEIKLLRQDHENPKYLPGVKIPEQIHLETDIQKAVAEKDVIVIATASKYIRSTAKQLIGRIPDGQILVNLAKGIESDSLSTLSEVIEEELPTAKICVLSGPSHAEEVARKLPTLVTIASHDLETAKHLQKIFASPVFRVYTSDDVLGIEIGGSLKNVIALAAGMADGVGYGDNVKAALITRGIREISRLAIPMGARRETLYGLSGMGDLIVTCASMHSRNRRAGILIGQGKTMEEAIAEVNMVVEGIVSAKAALELAEKHHVEMPIVTQVNKVLFENLPVREAVDNLMMRDLIAE
ncbi:MAG: NAD(P)H-dependent glycerol-3-phosphate dehydrogenase [Lachnospiraceae bacterium]|nr:NAD(P)H-dependent glycerol-3-phosphate dehydrogenase [Lachnospiraceae bacterium]